MQVLGGADLFLQGLITPEGGLGHFSAEDLRAVSIPQNAFPFAVGMMEVSSDDVARTGCAHSAHSPTTFHPKLHCRKACTPYGPCLTEAGSLWPFFQ